MDATSVTHSMQQAVKESKQSLRRARDRKRSINHRTHIPCCQDGGGGRGQVSSPSLRRHLIYLYPLRRRAFDSSHRRWMCWTERSLRATPGPIFYSADPVIDYLSTGKRYQPAPFRLSRTNSFTAHSACRSRPKQQRPAIRQRWTIGVRVALSTY